MTASLSDIHVVLVPYINSYMYVDKITNKL